MNLFVLNYYLIKKGKKWYEKSLNGRQIGIKKSTLSQIQRSQSIRDVFLGKINLPQVLITN